MIDASDQESWTFIHVADIHVGSPRSYRFQPAWNENWQTARRQIVDLDPDFLLVGGDLTRDGDTHLEELESIRDDLYSLPFPVHTIPGNHEVGNKYLPDSPVSINSKSLDLYSSVFGHSEWTFVHKGVRFSGFNAFLLGSGLPGEPALRSWLNEVSKLDNELHHVWMMHPALFIDAINEPDFHPIDDRTPWYFGLDREEREFVLDVFARSGATDVITGHIHCRRTVATQDITFHLAPSTAFSQWGDRWNDGDDSLGFLQFDVDEKSIARRFIPLEKTSTLTGYGPGGNPPKEGRDYSISLEKPPIIPVI